MCVYIYIYIYTSLSLYLSISLSLYIYLSLSLYIYIYIYIWLVSHVGHGAPAGAPVCPAAFRPAAQPMNNNDNDHNNDDDNSNTYVTHNKSNSNSNSICNSNSVSHRNSDDNTAAFRPAAPPPPDGSDASWLGLVQFSSFPRLVPADLRIKRFDSLRFGRFGSVSYSFLIGTGILRARVARVCWHTRTRCTCAVAVSIYAQLHE